MSSDTAHPAGSQRPVWKTAIIVLAVLFGLSEAVYVVLGSVAKACLAELASCGPLATGVSSALFAYYPNESGAQMFSNTFSVGLPGFNNFFYLFVAGFVIDDLGLLLATVAASIIIGFLVVWGYLAASAERSVAMRVVLAVAFAIGWWVLYNNTEASIYKSDVFALVWSRYMEVPIGVASLLIASFFARRRDV